MIEKIINDAIAAERREPRTEDLKFYCSDAGRCRLMRYRKRKGEAPSVEYDERTLRVFECGKIYERWVLDVIKRAGYLKNEQVYIEDEHRRGYIDAICQFDDKPIIYDVKTVHSRKFTYQPDDEHYKYQVVTYAMLYQEETIRDCRLLYVSKDDLRILEIGVPYEQYIERVKEDWYCLIKAWLRDIPPEANPKAWECKYCIFRDNCDYSLPEDKPKKINKLNKEEKND